MSVEYIVTITCALIFYFVCFLIQVIGPEDITSSSSTTHAHTHTHTYMLSAQLSPSASYITLMSLCCSHLAGGWVPKVDPSGTRAHLAMRFHP